MEMSLDLTVKDVRASAEFYRRVGLDVPPVWEQDGAAHHVEVKQSLMLNSRQLTRGYDPSWPDDSGVILVFQVEDRTSVDAKFAELTSAGFVAHLEPIDAFWGSRYAIVDDPDGNHVGLMSPVEQERKQAPTLSTA